MSDTEVLRAALYEAVDGLTDIGWKKMFGCEAVFRDGTIFGLIWKEGCIGLKFVNPTEFELRMEQEGSQRWEPGGRVTKHWVLIPQAAVDDEAALKEWVQTSHSSIF